MKETAPMMHGSATPQMDAADPFAARIARLSREFLDADRTRRDEIGAEIRALLSRRVVPFPGRPRTD